MRTRFPGTLILIVGVVLTPLSLEGTEDGFWSSMARRLSEDYRAGEVREERLREQMSRLPSMPERPSGGTQGFLSRLRLEPVDADVTKDSIDLIWDEDRKIDTIVLCQVRNAIPELSAINMGVPEHFQIWSLDATGSPDRLLVNVFENGGDPVRETYPYYFGGLDFTARGIRIQSLASRYHGENYHYFWGWSEVFCFSGKRNIAPEARLSTNAENQGRLFILDAYLADEQTQLGLPHVPKEHRSQGWLSNSRQDPEHEVWVDVDLQQLEAVDSIRLHPSNRLDNPEIQGFGFPVRFKIEAFDSEDDSSPEMLVDWTTTDFDNPGNNPVTLRFPTRSAKKIRITATRLWSPRTDAFIHLAFSEIEVLRDELNLALGKPVASIDDVGDLGLHNDWHAGEFYLTDGLVPGGRVVSHVEWLGLLEERRDVAADLSETTEELVRIRTAIETTSIRTISGAAIFLALAVPPFVLILKVRQRQAILNVKKQIASDLHDEVGSNLGGIRMMANTLKRKPDQAVSISSRIQETVSESAESLRDIIWLLAPVKGERRELTRRFQFLTEILLSDFKVEFELPDAASSLKWPLTVRRELIFFFREALHNISRHSNATAVRICMDVSRKQAVLQISDDGKGISREVLDRPETLSNLKLRAAKLKAKLEISTAPGNGTSLTLMMDRSDLGF